MKKILLFLAITIISFMYGNEMYGQTSGKGVLMINVYESEDIAYNKIIVTEGEKKLEEIPLLRFYFKDLDANKVTINNAINKYVNEGYIITQSLRGTVLIGRGNFTSSIMETTYILQKR